MPSVDLEITAPPTINPLESGSSPPFLRLSDLFPPRHVFSGFSRPSHSCYDADPDFCRIITPYSSTAFKSTLRELNLFDQYPDLPDKLKYGFPIGNLPPLVASYIPPNHSNISEHRDAIREYIDDELRLGRFSGPFTSAQLFHEIGPFRSSPFQVVVKHVAEGLPPKICVCRNLSFKGSPRLSINDQINSDDFPTRWGSAEIAASIIARSPPGTQAASLDIEAAYRAPILPDHKCFLVVMFDDELFLDHVLPFGLSPASGLQGEVADAIIDIWDAILIGPSIKWVDDFNLFRSPSPSGRFLGICDGEVYRYDYDLDHAKQVISHLGVPWHKEKGQPFRDSVEYLGFLWHTPHKTVSLIESKRIKYLARVNAFLASLTSRVFKRDAERIAGTLNHITFVFPFARSFLSPLYQWISEFPDEFGPRFARPSIISDIKWWSVLLSSSRPPISIATLPPPIDPDIWVDASSDFGIGLLFNGSWAAWSLAPDWRAPHHDIGWLETLAIELAINLIASCGFQDSSFIIPSDNQGAIAAFEKGRSRNFMSNLCIRCAALLAHEARLHFTFTYVTSASNLADPISRGNFPDAAERLPDPPTLDPSICRLLTNVVPVPN